jgi:arsenate reductase
MCGDAYDIYSAGTHPWVVRPGAIETMAEVGIDISQKRSKSVDEFVGQQLDYVLTVCDNAQAECPIFPATTQTIHHAFEDPVYAEYDSEERRVAFRRVREAIKQYLEEEFVPFVKQKESTKWHSPSRRNR